MNRVAFIDTLTRNTNNNNTPRFMLRTLPHRLSRFSSVTWRAFKKKKIIEDYTIECKI